MMLAWEHGGGFSLNAEVWAPAWDHVALEHLLHYCARRIFACEQME
jgi:hypothetical protein